MGNILKNLEVSIELLAEKTPLEVFSFAGSFLEELIAPIPSPLVMATAGTIAHLKNHGLVYLLFLALLASCGKTIASWLLYVLADKLEDFMSSRFGKILGFSHKDIENIGRHFNGTIKDDIILVALRALPIMPTSAVTLVCGFIKLDIRTFLRSTFIGYFIRSFIFLYIGFTGVATYKTLIRDIEGLEYFITVAVLVLLVVFLGLIYIIRRKYKNKNEIIQ